MQIKTFIKIIINNKQKNKLKDKVLENKQKNKRNIR